MYLVYACVFYNADYIRLLELLLLSLRFYSKGDFDILILTSESFMGKISDLSQRIGLPLQIHCLPCSTIFEAACARLHIFDWPRIGFYKKILYIDTDIIIRRDMTTLFNLELDDLLYGYPSGTLESPQFGGQFFNFSIIDHTLSGVNSGTLLFNNCQVIRDLFTRIRSHIDEHLSQGKAIPIVMDQPFINYHAFLSGLCNTALLTPYISLYEDTLEVNNCDTAIVCHFSYPIGNFGHKYARMCDFFKGLVTEKKTSTLNLAGRRYAWELGFISFHIDKVETTWGKGIFTLLGDNVVRVVWNSHDHILKFSDDLSEYMSIRIAPRDFDCVLGSLSDATFSADKRDE